MLLTWLAILTLSWSLYLLFAEDSANALRSAFRHEERTLQTVIFVLQEFEETLEAGLVPDDSRWDRIARLPAPWGRVAAPCLRELREAGGALLPTLKRLRSAACHHRDTVKEARARSAQAMAQAGICAAIGPVAGFSYYLLLPGLDARPELWASVCFVALLMSAAAGFWMLRIAERAQWAGLPAQQRGWVLASQVATERMLAAIRAGMPPDQAWAKSVDQLRSEGRELASCWGESVWQPALGELDGTRDRLRGTARFLADFGDGMRKGIQSSLMEGRPVTERIESALAACRAEVKAAVERELSLLSTRSLKPLFFLVAPSLVGMLVAGFLLSTISSTNGGF